MTVLLQSTIIHPYEPYDRDPLLDFICVLAVLAVLLSISVCYSRWRDSKQAPPDESPEGRLR